MRYFLITVAVFCGLKVYSQEDYIVRLNDTSFNASLDKQYNIVVNGQVFNLIINQKDTLAYNDRLYGFNYPKGFNVSSTKIDDGVEQISILTAEGAGFLIQKYSSINPNTLNELMLKELTKESVSYGYELKRSDDKKHLQSGLGVEVNKAILTYKNSVNIYEVASIGKKDEGLVIVTIRMDGNENSQGKKIIDLMWRSLKINF